MGSSVRRDAFYFIDPIQDLIYPKIEQHKYGASERLGLSVVRRYAGGYDKGSLMSLLLGDPAFKTFAELLKVNLPNFHRERWNVQLVGFQRGYITSVSLNLIECE